MLAVINPNTIIVILLQKSFYLEHESSGLTSSLKSFFIVSENCEPETLNGQPDIF